MKLLLLLSALLGIFGSMSERNIDISPISALEKKNRAAFNKINAPFYI